MCKLFLKELPDEMLLYLRMSLPPEDYRYWCEPALWSTAEPFIGYVNHKLFDSDKMVDWIEYEDERYALLCEDDDPYIAGLSPCNPGIRIDRKQSEKLQRGESIRE